MSEHALAADPFGQVAREVLGLHESNAPLLRAVADGTPEEREAAELELTRRSNVARLRRETTARDVDSWEDRDDQAAPEAAAFVPALELLSAPVGELLVEDMSRPRYIVVLVAESGSGKTFLAMSMAVAIGDGHEEWFGRKLKPGSVAYITFEGDALQLRLQALQGQGARLENLYFLRAEQPMSPRLLRDGIEEPSIGEAHLIAALEQLVAMLRQQGRPPIVAIVFDTVRASLAGSEDNSADVAAYLRAVRRILAHAPTAAAYLVHHSGWQDGEQKKKRERGSSAFRGNADTTVYLEVVEDDAENHRAFLELRTLKVRDSERPAPLRLVRQRVDVQALDSRGQPLSSCVILADPRRREDREAEAAEAARAEDQAQDLRTLRAIADRPALATSQDRVRQLLGVGKAIASQSIGRLIQAGWVAPGRRGEAYTVTPEGQQVLSAEGQR